MRERLVENWLTRVNERSLEVPFCQLLTAEGYEVIHLTRHGPFEEGKDILAIAPDGIPCAYQLKSGKITQKVWTDIDGQVRRLVEIPIRHPSLSDTLERRVYLVTTGDLDEEVRVEIEHRNLQWTENGYPILETIVKRQLVPRFNAQITNFWPVQLKSEKSLLEFFLSKGNDCLDKQKLAELLADGLPLDVEVAKAECSRTLAGAAIVNTYALSSYTDMNNHVALIEGWMIYIALLTSLVEKNQLERTYWIRSFELATYALESAFIDLIDELKSRSNYIEGDTLVDTPFFRGRMTWLLGLTCGYYLWKLLRDPKWKKDNWFRDFLEHNKEFLRLWGESAVPQFLAIIWFLRKTTATKVPDDLLYQLIEAICAANENENSPGLPTPYKTLEEVIAETFGFSDNYEAERYLGRSYALESIVSLYVKRNWRVHMKLIWAQITRISFAEFRPDTVWEYPLWRIEEDGTLITKQPKLTQSWAELRAEAASTDKSLIPVILQENPGLFVIFLLVFPHRLTNDSAKFLDNFF